MNSFRVQNTSSRQGWSGRGVAGDDARSQYISSILIYNRRSWIVSHKHSKAIIMEASSHIKSSLDPHFQISSHGVVWLEENLCPGFVTNGRGSSWISRHKYLQQSAQFMVVLDCTSSDFTDCSPTTMYFPPADDRPRWQHAASILSHFNAIQE